MVVIIPHQNDQLKIISLQKKILSHLEIHGIVLVQSLPLWIYVDEHFPLSHLSQKADPSPLKAFSKIIKAVKLQDICCDEKGFYSPVIIECESQNLKGRLSIIDFLFTDKNLQKTISYTSMLKKICTEKDFPCMLKIFKLGTEVRPSNTSKAIEETQWVKLSE